MNYAHWVVLSLLVCAVTAQPASLNFNVGDELSYTLNAVLDTKGFDVTTNTRTGGSFGNMTSTVVIQCTDQDDTSYTFAMNMWNTAVDVGQGDMLASELTVVGDGDWLGDDMYFQQAKTGEMMNIWYQDGDSPYFIEVKIGAINAFQTHIVPVSASQSFLETDPVGVHTSNFVGAIGDSQALLVTKNFNQNDIQSFTDANLQASNILLTAQTQTAVHPSGYILSSGVAQQVNFVSVVQNPSQEVKATQNGDASTTALNVQFSSVGSLDIEFAGFSSTKHLSTSYNTKELATNGHISGNLFQAAQSVIKMKQDLKASRKFGSRHHGASIDKLVSHFITTNDHQKLTRLYSRMSRALGRDQDNLNYFVARMEPLLSDPLLRNKYFTVLVRIPSQSLIISYLNSQVEDIQVEMIRHVQLMENPNEELVSEIIKIIRSESSKISAKQAGFLAIGSMSRRVTDIQTVKKISMFLIDSLSHDNDMLTSVIHAIGNAGPQVFDLSHLSRVTKFVTHSDSLVRKAAKMTLQKFQFPVAWETSNFPFNKSYDYDAKLGGASINADFDVDLFAGSNFDCKQTTFNYEASAVATATLNMWSYSKQAFLAETVYGQVNSQVLANEILVQVFDDVIYHQALPSIDCVTHSYPLYQTSPAFSVSYTLWVAVIPVVFSASADLNFALSWGYDVCPSELDAEVDLNANGGITLSGDAVVDLLIIQAGIELDGSFNTELTPQLYVHGTECEVGIDVQRTSSPMNVDFTAYYAWKDCKLWIFDCHWGQHNQDTLFSWDYPSVNEIIYNQDWQIQL